MKHWVFKSTIKYYRFGLHNLDSHNTLGKILRPKRLKDCLSQATDIVKQDNEKLT